MIERIVVLFLDGVGLGEDNAEFNPFSRTNMPALAKLLGGHRLVLSNAGLSTQHASLIALDAQMGVSGLPQSGTGQTSLLTGVNAAALLGHHDGPYPNLQLRDLLQAKNLFTRVLDTGNSAAFANAYSDQFLERQKRGTQRLGANSRAAVLAGLQLRSPADLKVGKAVSGLLTNDYFREWGYDVPGISVTEAGQHLASLANEHALTFFEMWYTDVAGHRRDWPLAQRIVTMIDQFVEGILDKLDLDKSLIVVASDHGNIEDLRTSKHTHNPALGLLVGNQHQILAPQLQSLTDVTPMLLSTLNNHR